MRKKQGIEVGGVSDPKKKNVNGHRVGSTNGPNSIVAEKGDGLAALFGNKKRLQRTGASQIHGAGERT